MNRHDKAALALSAMAGLAGVPVGWWPGEASEQRRRERLAQSPRRLTLRIAPVGRVGTCGVSFDMPTDANPNPAICPNIGALYSIPGSVAMCESCITRLWNEVLDEQLDCWADGKVDGVLSTAEAVTVLAHVFGISRAQAAKAVRGWRKRRGEGRPR